MSKRILALAGCAGVFAAGATTVLADPIARVVLYESGNQAGTVFVEQDGIHYCGNNGYLWVGDDYAHEDSPGAIAGTNSECPQP